MSNRRWKAAGLFSGGIFTVLLCISAVVLGSGVAKSTNTTQSQANYTITSTAGPNGSISPGTITVAGGSGQTFTISPSPNFHVASVIVDGVSLGAITSYTFNRVNANHNIAATFALDTYGITVASSVGGSITPSGIVTVVFGGSQTFTITPDPSYSIMDVQADGVSQGSRIFYTFNNVAANHTLNAIFAIDSGHATGLYQSQPFNITASVSAGGSISPSGTVPMSRDGSQLFVISPNTGYHIVDIKVDGVSRGVPTSYTFTNVTSNHSITATFAADSAATTTNILSLIHIILDDLNTLRASINNQQDGQKVDAANKAITTSISPSYWLDSAHLQPKSGNKVFDYDVNAVNHLSELMKNKKQAAISSATLQSLIGRIAETDRLLATTAIADASKVTAKNVAKANQEVTQGNTDASLNKYASAIQHYSNAWQIAQTR